MGHTPTLVVRADGGPGIGAGHLARQLALVQAWVDGRGRALLVSDDPAPAWAARYAAEGVELVPPGDPGWFSGADWIVLDGYRFGRETQDLVAGTGGRLLVVDDHGTIGSWNADVVLDQNLGTRPDTYDRRPADADLLLGPRFALLRREFRTRAGRSRQTPDRARTLLVSLGGSPERAVREAAAAVLADHGLGHLRAQVLAGVGDVAAAMAEADVALAASGSTSWELCCMGLPAVLVSVAPNQTPLAAALASAGAAVAGGPLTSRPPGDIAALVASLAADGPRRRELSRRGQALVDGRGASRVAARLRADLLRLRPATMTDARLLWGWANDPAVRMAGASPAPIPFETHVEWLAGRFRDPRHRLFIAADSAGALVGQVRFDPPEIRPEIGVLVAPEHRGRGWAPALVLAGIREMAGRGPATEVVARVRPENTASHATFAAADFELTDEVSPDREGWLHYVRRVDAPYPFASPAWEVAR